MGIRFERTPETSYESLRDHFRWELPDAFNMGVACADDQDPDTLALIEVRPGAPVREHTFGDLAAASTRFAHALRRLGVERGDRVAVMLPQGLECGVTHLATYKLGAIALPLTQLFGPDAVRYRVADCHPKVVVTDRTTLELVSRIAEEVGGIQIVVVADDPVPTEHNFAQLVEDAPETPLEVVTGPDDPALLIYTSGTTGAPKGALHGHRVLLGHLPAFQLMFDFYPQPGDRMWTPADWAWIGGLLDAVLPSWYFGRPVVATPKARFDPEWALNLMADHAVTATFLPPTALKLMRQAALPDRDLALRTIMSGGEPLGSEILAWAQGRFGVKINEIYGQTEANLLVGNSSTVWPVRPGSMGRAFPGHHVAILGADGALAPTGQEGEIVVRGDDPVAMLEYWGNPRATAAKYVDILDESGKSTAWLRTGDLGRADEDGYLWFVSRDDDVITSAGYRIGPSEIEECVLGHPAVLMVAAVGVPDQIRGEVVKIFVKLAPGREPSDELADEIREHVRIRLAAYEYPREVEFLDELPTTTTGKVRRCALREGNRAG